MTTPPPTSEQIRDEERFEKWCRETNPGLYGELAINASGTGQTKD